MIWDYKLSEKEKMRRSISQIIPQVPLALPEEE